MQPELWNDGHAYFDSVLEAELAASIAIENARRVPVPQVSAPRPLHTLKTNPTAHIQDTTLAQLVGGCGIAAIDGYLAMKDYAASKGLDLIELHHKGIDLQDLVSTLVIHTQKMSEADRPVRWKR